MSDNDAPPVRCTGWMGEMAAALWHAERAEKMLCDIGERDTWVCVNRAKEALKSAFDAKRQLSPIDPKLSDCGARRAGCGKAAGAGWAQAAGWRAAASVTRGAVRCSAWLGVRSDLRQRWRVAAKRGVKAGAALRSAASGGLLCSADGSAAEGGWGAGRKLPAKRTDARAGDVERSCALDCESEAQTGTTPLIAARVAAWPKPGDAKSSKPVRHAARTDAPDLPADDRITGD